MYKVLTIFPVILPNVLEYGKLNMNG